MSIANCYQMKIMIKYLFLLFIVLPIIAFAQPGAHVYAGISTLRFDNDVMTPEGTAHRGYHIGVDARLNDGDSYFMAGLVFHNLNLTASTDKNHFTIDNKMQFLKMRLGIQAHLLKLTSAFEIRGKVLLVGTRVLDYRRELLPGSFTEINEAVGGVLFGIGAELLAFTLDLSYELGLTDGLLDVEGSKMHVLSLNAGFFF